MALLRRRFGSGSFLLALALAPAGAARATEAPPPAPPTATPSGTGQAEVDRAAERFRARDFEGALAALIAAAPAAEARQDPALATLRFNIARCLEELGRGPEAIEAYEAYLRLPDDGHRKERAWAAIRALEPRSFAALHVSCAPAGARVELAGVTTGPEGCPLDRTRLAPGTYELHVSAVGHLPETRAVELRIGQPANVDVALTPAPGATPAVPVGTGPETPSRLARPWAWVATGAGLGAAGLGIWLTGTAQDTRDEASTLAPGGHRQDAVSRYHTREALSWGAYGLALSGLVTGAVLFAWPPEVR